MEMSVKECLDNWRDLTKMICSDKVYKFLEDEEWIVLPDFAKLYLHSEKSPIQVHTELFEFIKHGFDVNTQWNSAKKKWTPYVGYLDRDDQFDVVWLEEEFDNYFDSLNGAMEWLIDNLVYDGKED